MDNYTEYKILILLIKYIPIVGAFVMICHIIGLLNGYYVCIAEYLFGFSILGTLLLLLASYVLKFCNIHRLFILYDFIVESCINYLQYFDFSAFRKYMLIIMLLIGINLFIYFIYVKLSKNNSKCSLGICR